MKRRTVLQVAAIVAVVPLTRTARAGHQWAVGDLAMLDRLGLPSLPMVCVIVDGDCVNFENITDGKISATAQPDTDFRPATKQEIAKHWKDMARTVWENGTWQDHHIVDAYYAEDDYDWEATVPCGTWPESWNL